MRTCSKCGTEKIPEEFYKKKRQNGKYGLMAECKVCWAVRCKESAKKDPDRKEKARLAKKRWRERNTEYSRHKHLLDRYGIGLKERDAIALLQGHCCKICNQERPLVVDHSHDDGSVRGLLCQQCNCLLGMAQDKKDILESAIRYLENVDANARY